MQNEIRVAASAKLFRGKSIIGGGCDGTGWSACRYVVYRENASVGSVCVGWNCSGIGPQL